MIELLDIKNQDPEDYEGKSIMIFDKEYLVGRLVGEGGYKLVYQLINKKSGICNYVIKIPINQQLAAGTIKYAHNQGSPWADRSFYDYCREVAKKTYNYDGYRETHLPIFADFLDIPEFSSLDNKYNGIFMISEFFNGPGDDITGGIYTRDMRDDFEETRLLLRINLNSQSNDEKKVEKTVLYTKEFLDKYNPYNDTIMEKYIIATIKLSNFKKPIDKDYTLELTKRMLMIEPFLKSHIRVAMEIFHGFNMHRDVITLFESFENIIYEPFSDYRMMLILENAFLILKQFDKAKYYAKYLAPSDVIKIEHIISGT